MKSFDCLDPHQSIEGTIFLEASAGTGKTFAIEHIVCRLLLEGRSLAEILITTFTKKGVRDLRKRIFSCIEDNLSLLENGDALPHYLANISNRNEAILTLKNQMALLNEAEIHTIHSFCYRCLSEHAFEAGFTLDDEDPESEKKKEEVHTAILDTLRTTLDDQEFSPAQLMRLMSHFQRDTQKLVKKIAQILDQDHPICSYPSYSSLRSQYEKALQEIDLPDLQQILHNLLPHHKKCCDRQGNPHSPFLQQIAQLSDFEALIKASPSIFDVLTPDNQKGKEKIYYPDVLTQLRPIVKKAADPLITFMRLAQKAAPRVEKISLKNPNTLLDEMCTRLTHQAFCQKIRGRFSSIIIDEFQDTDPKQWKIFHSLFFHYANPFVVVGDPKQSIYAFRGADLATYLQASDAFSHHYRLVTNYRTSKNVIETLNDLFDEQHVPGLFTFEKETPSLFHHTINPGKQEMPNSGIEVWISQTSEEAIIEAMSEEIKMLITEKGWRLSQIAILVKDRFQAERVTQCLEGHFLPLHTSATQNLTEMPAFSFVEMTLKLREQPRNTSLFNQFLSHPFVGWPLDALVTDLRDPALSSAMMQFFSLVEEYRNEDAPTFLRALLQKKFGDRSLLENCVQKVEDYHDLMQVIEIIFSQSRTHPLKAIATLKKRSEEGDLSLKRRSVADEEALSLLTMHMSKGLEFDVVFPLGIMAPTKTKQEFATTSSHQLGRFSATDPESQKHLLKLDCEKMRLFYVALTRTKVKLYLPFLLTKMNTSPQLGSASCAQLYLTRLIAQAPLSHLQTYAHIPSLSIEAALESLKQFHLSIRNIDHHPVRHYQNQLPPSSPVLPPEKSVQLCEPIRRIASFSSLAKPHHSSFSINEDEKVLPHGPLTGTLFHLLFEKLIETGKTHPWDATYIDTFLKQELHSTHLVNWKDTVYELITTAFHTDLGGFQLQDIPPDQMLQEMPFLYDFDHHLTIKGFADLFFMYQGRFYLLDWKLNRLPDYTPKTLQCVMEDNDYLMQAQLYTEAVKRYTKTLFPDQDFEDLFGGAIYFFLRGGDEGIYHVNKESLDSVVLGGLR